MQKIDERIFLLWRCEGERIRNNGCSAVNIRATKMTPNKARSGRHFSDIQSPCPKCGLRKRLYVDIDRDGNIIPNSGNCRIYATKEEANQAKELISGRWL